MLVSVARAHHRCYAGLLFAQSLAVNVLDHVLSSRDAGAWGARQDIVHLSTSFGHTGTENREFKRSLGEGKMKFSSWYLLITFTNSYGFWSALCLIRKWMMKCYFMVFWAREDCSDCFVCDSYVQHTSSHGGSHTGFNIKLIRHSRLLEGRLQTTADLCRNMNCLNGHLFPY